MNSLHFNNGVSKWFHGSNLAHHLFLYNPPAKNSFSFFFSPFLATLRHMEFLGQGSDSSHSCNLCWDGGGTYAQALQRCHQSCCAIAGTPTFFFLLHRSIWKFLGQGLNLSYICDLYHSCCNIWPLTHCATWEHSYSFKWLENMKRRIFYDTWKWYEAQIFVSTKRLFFFFLGLHLQHTEAPRLGLNQSCSLWLTPQPQQHGIRATSVTYITAQGNTVSLTHWARPGIKSLSSWMLVRFVFHWTTMGSPLKAFMDTPT